MEQRVGALALPCLFMYMTPAMLLESNRTWKRMSSAARRRCSEWPGVLGVPMDIPEDSGGVCGAGLSKQHGGGGRTGNACTGEHSEQAASRVAAGTVGSRLHRAFPSTQGSLGTGAVVCRCNISPNLAQLGEETLCFGAVCNRDLLQCP